VDTGENAGTGARLFRCKQYLEDGDFFATYTDCLSNVVLDDLLKFHNEHNRIATVTGVLPPFRYGEFILKDNTPISYSPNSKLNSVAGIVNGGFMVFRKGIFNYVDTFDESTIEGGGGTFEKLSADTQLQVFRHSGFWQCLDNDREYKMLNDLCEKNSAYWLV
ncbi:MAG: hypothetical protein M0Q92_16305, partial [Methanoregula sp.]|nr:hypothetical protein [Methanoregula sp.]